MSKAKFMRTALLVSVIENIIGVCIHKQFFSALLNAQTLSIKLDTRIKFVKICKMISKRCQNHINWTQQMFYA